MAYRVTILPEALEQLATLPKHAKKSADQKIAALAHNPRPPGHKKLEGADYLYRIEVAKDYRIIYQIAGEILQVLVVRVGHRKDVHRRLPKRMTLQWLAGLTEKRRKK